jgi:hypothetical protein
MVKTENNIERSEGGESDADHGIRPEPYTLHPTNECTGSVLLGQESMLQQIGGRTSYWLASETRDGRGGLSDQRRMAMFTR